MIDIRRDDPDSIIMLRADADEVEMRTRTGHCKFREIQAYESKYVSHKHKMRQSTR